MGLLEKLKEKLTTLEIGADDVITILGLVFAFKICYAVLIELKNGMLGYLLPRVWYHVFGQNYIRSRYGDWAVVTGSSQGIGKSYAEQLAARGLNIVLVARNKERLNSVAETIQEKYGVKTEIIVVDFTDNRAVKTVVKELDKMKIDVGVLVNNVGMMGPPHFAPFLDYDEDTARDMITVNCISTTMMCHAILPRMLAKNKGAIINIASSSSFYIMPYFNEYAATKHYMAAFTQGLMQEVGESDVVIQEVDPGQTNTNMTREMIPLPRTAAPPPDWFVESSILSLGWSSRTGGWWFHSLHRLVSSLLPHCLLSRVLFYFGKWQYQYSSSKKTN